MRNKEQFPWVVIGPKGVNWLGLAEDEEHAWTIAFGWPSQEEIDYYKRAGWYAAQATLTWSKP